MVDSERIDKKMTLKTIGLLCRPDGELLIDRADQVTALAGALVLDTTSATACLDGAELRLSKIDFDLLHYFMRNRGVIVSKWQIVHNVWKRDCNLQEVESYVCRIRKELARHTDVKCISTHLNLGYMFIGDKTACS